MKAGKPQKQAVAIALKKGRQEQKSPNGRSDEHRDRLELARLIYILAVPTGCEVTHQMRPYPSDLSGRIWRN